MTERCWLTSPTIHSHYHLFTVPDSRQTKQKATLGGAKKSSLLYKLRHKAKHNQTMTFSQHPPSRWRSPPAPHREINTRPAHMITQSQQSQTKEDDGHAHRRKVEEWHTAGTDVRAKNSTDVWKVWIKIQIVMEGGGGTQIFFFKGDEITVVFKVWQEKARRPRGQSERNWSVLAYRHTPHFYHSEGDRQSLLGLTRVVITRLQRGSDSNMTRMNGLASYPNRDTCCWRNYTFIWLLISFSQI